MLPEPERPLPRLARATPLAVLVAVSATTFGVSAFLAFSPAAKQLSVPQAQALQLLNLALSGAALLCAGAVAWHVFDRRLRARSGGMITVCAWTRRVLWDGRWISFEEYLAQRFNLRCTHGICAEAAAKLRADDHRDESADGGFGSGEPAGSAVNRGPVSGT